MDNWLNNNNVLKIVAFLLALMLWLVVSLDTTNNPNKISFTEDVQTYYYEAKVLPVYNEQQYEVRMLTEQVNVTLRGKKDLIEQIRNGQNIDRGQFFINLTDYEAGVYTGVPIQYSGFPSDIDVEIQPSVIEVELEAKQRKELEVLVDKLGKEAEGYQSGEPIIKPKKVHIAGTEDQIKKIAFVKAFINIDNVESPILEQVPLRALDKNGNVIEVEITPQTVEVQIPVTSPYKTIPVTYKISKYPPEGHAIESINQLTKEVTIYGPKDEIDSYSVYKGPELDLSDITDKQIISIDLPLNANLLKTEPNFVEFEVTVVESTTKTISNVPVEVNGLSEGLNVEIITPVEGIDIILEGAPKTLEELTTDDLQAFVDVTNLPPGEHEVLIQFNVPLLTKHIGTTEMANVRITKE